MNLYNQLFGVNPLSDVLLAVIDLPFDKIPRFRDTSIVDDGDSIMVFTRTGGGNRDGYVEENNFLVSHPLYLRDKDSELDSTYAEFFFRVPDNFKEQIKQLASQGKGTVDPMTQFKELLEKIESGNQDDPQVQRAMAVAEKIVDSIQNANESGGGIVEI